MGKSAKNHQKVAKKWQKKKHTKTTELSFGAADLSDFKNISGKLKKKEFVELRLKQPNRLVSSCKSDKISEIATTLSHNSKLLV